MEAVARSDAELVEASRRGEHAAFGHLVERYQGVVCAVSYSSTGDRVLSEDVAQETFIAAWRQLDQLRETVRLRAWLCGIARNLGRKARNRNGRETLVDQPPAVHCTGASPFEAASDAEAEKVVRDALDRVPETYREVLVLYYRENRSAKEVADTLGISEAAVLQRLARGRQHLADGVTDLVERSLESARPRRGLTAGVLAALPALPGPAEAASHVQPLASSHGGWTMIKLALAAAALAAAGTTAYVVHSHTTDATPAQVARPAPAPVATTPVAHSQPLNRFDPATAPRLAVPGDDLPANTIPTPEPDEVPIANAGMIEKIKLHDGPGRGPAKAPVTIVVFTDLLCTFCGQVLGTIDQLWDEYRGKIRLVVKQFPVHTEAVLASEAALAADAQGKFWELHDLMLANQHDLSRDALVDYAQQVGLDVKLFAKALDQHLYADAVKADMDTGRAIDIQATPSFVINGRRFVGARPIAEFRAMIDEALETATP
jgi:RNA polymerase sigma factor (sigma-70 family)